MSCLWTVLSAYINLYGKLIFTWIYNQREFIIPVYDITNQILLNTPLKFFPAA